MASMGWHHSCLVLCFLLLAGCALNSWVASALALKYTIFGFAPSGDSMHNHCLCRWDCHLRGLPPLNWSAYWLGHIGNLAVHMGLSGGWGQLLCCIGSDIRLSGRLARISPSCHHPPSALGSSVGRYRAGCITETACLPPKSSSLF